MDANWGVLDVSALLLLLYSSALTLVLGWCGWSVAKHGWKKGGLRRVSYVLFALFLVARICWCAVLMAEAMGILPLASDSAAIMTVTLGPTSRLLMAPAARLLDCVAYCLHFAVLWLLVCGWAESRYMMSEMRSIQAANARSPALFEHYGRFYLLANLGFATVLGVGLMPLLISPDSNEWVRAGEMLDLVVTAGFSLMLAIASVFAGLSVSCRMVSIISVEPSLTSYAHAKARKVTLAASVFGVTGLSRTCILLHVFLAAMFHDSANDINCANSTGRAAAEGHIPSTHNLIPIDLTRHQPPPPPLHMVDRLPCHPDHLLSPPVFLAMGVALPDLLPTLVALFVLRRRSRLGWCFGRRSSTDASGLLWGSVDRAPLRGGYGSEYDGQDWRAAGPWLGFA